MDNILYISESDQLKNNLLTMDTCIDAISEMFHLMYQGKYLMSGKNGNSHGSRLSVSVDGKDNIFITMPAYLGGNYEIVGVKFHGPNRHIFGNSNETNHMIMLYQSETGKPFAILNGNALTTYRTAAVSVYATKILLKKEPAEVGIIGPGKINTEYMKWLIKQYPSIQRIKIKGRGASSTEKFAEIMKHMADNIEIVICDELKEAVIDSDIVSIITGFEFENVAEMPFIREKWIKDKALIICPAFVKFSDSFMQKANLVVDNFKMYESYAEELGKPVYAKLSNLGNLFVDLIDKGKISPQDVIDIYQIAYGNERITDDRPTVFSSGGMGIEDIAVSFALIREAEKKNIGTKLEY